MIRGSIYIKKECILNIVSYALPQGKD